MPRGFVDLLTHQQIMGWLAPETGDPPGHRFIRVYVDGIEFGTVRANLFRPDLRDKGISDGYSGFKFLFATSPDPFVDHVIEVRDRDCGTPVLPCPTALRAVIESSPESMLEFDRSVVATHLAAATYANETWEIEVWLIGPKRLAFKPSIINGTIEAMETPAFQLTPWIASDIYRHVAKFKIKGNHHSHLMYLDLLQKPSDAGAYAPVCRIALPPNMPRYLADISEENMTRVSGPRITRDVFAASGVNTAFRLESILMHHFGRGLGGFNRILDWGIGPGRVSVPIKRSIAPNVQIDGIDVDEFNIAFGKATYPDIEFVQSPFYPPLHYEDLTFDAAFGISVVTHLTEQAQFAWLKELRRLVKQGSPVILTVHGDYSLVEFAKLDPAIVGEALTRGISDRLQDTNLGPKIREKSYYRATLHARKYIDHEWAKYFDVIAHYPCANVLIQDFVVLRAK
jgi:SAM-dependent methyltransferase